MFDLANAMKLAYHNAMKRNPDSKQTTIIQYKDNDGKDQRLEATFLGQGSWTNAYTTKNNDVILTVDESEFDGDPTKQILSDFNKVKGEMAFIPFVQRIGTDADNDGVYRVPLYRPLSNDRKDWFAFQAVNLLEDLIFEAKEDTFPSHIKNVKDMTLEDWNNWSRNSRKQFQITLFEAEVPMYWEPLAWLVAIKNLDSLVEFSFRYNRPIMMEIHVDNVAIDGNGQLIFLDLFLDGLSTARKQGKVS